MFHKYCVEPVLFLFCEFIKGQRLLCMLHTKRHSAGDVYGACFCLSGSQREREQTLCEILNCITSALIKQNIQHALVLAQAHMHTHAARSRYASSFLCECRTLSSRSIFVVVALGTLICIRSTRDDKWKIHAHSLFIILLLLYMTGLVARRGVVIGTRHTNERLTASSLSSGSRGERFDVFEKIHRKSDGALLS